MALRFLPDKALKNGGMIVMEYLDSLLERLTQAIGVGYGGDVTGVIVEALAAEGIDAHAENDGSVSAHLEGSGKSGVMLACHIDEIGYIVSRIDERGRIFFSEIGGADVRVLPGQEVTVLGRKKYHGYIGFKPPHLLSTQDRERVLPIEELYIDVGLKAEAVKKNIQIGDYIAFKGEYSKMQGDLRSAKALDNRASVACGILVLKELAKMEHGLHVHFVATSQEEYTFRMPVDFAIIVDVSHAEHPDLKEHEYFPLDRGPTIVRGATVPAKLSDLLIETAKELEIPYQLQPVPSRTGTDADDIAFSREGIASCIVGIPLRYMHTPVEIVSLKDIERAARLITDFTKRLEVYAITDLK
jgi:putative aminopeptidase FrvX